MSFTETAWAEYVKWQSEDKKTLKRINALIKDIAANGLDKGIGKPERLRHIDAYSRRIDEKNRLVYDSLGKDGFVVLSCKDHYDDK